MEVTKISFDGLMAVGSFTEVTEILEWCNIVDAEWLHKWKSDSRRSVWLTGQTPYGSYGVSDRKRRLL